MRRRDFRGAQEWRGADWLIRSRIVRRWVGWKMAGSWRFCEDGGVSGGRGWRTETSELTVMSRVFEGGDGLIKGGIDERSRDSGVCVPLDAGLDDCEIGGEVLPFDMIATPRSSVC